ncbi:MAG: hypothetical protein IPK79_00380 [Vampirovibrionales bacterium]|nr:hypothetical protein [Vampirovibrionales bacterium]
MAPSWLWRGAVLAVVAGVDVVLVLPLAMVTWLMLGSLHKQEERSAELVFGERYIRLKG